jgi:CheY-like chemotaxis protein
MSLTEKSAKPGLDGNSRGLPVLVVDDNPILRQIYRRVLEAEGFAVQEAESGNRALQLIGRSRPALVLLDLMMVDMDGFKFLDQLRSRSDGADLPVVVLSAKPLGDLEREYVAAHAQGFVRKSDKSAAEAVALVKRLLSPPAA